MADWLIVPMTDTHERGEFSCGKAPLDVFLQKQAGQYARKRVGRTFVAVRPDSNKVIGYYTLAASAVGFADVPTEVSKKLPKHPVPCVLLGRLAVDVSARGIGLGADLLIDGLKRTLRLADELGVFAVHTHAIDDDARGFYEKFGFRAMLDQPRHMFMPMETVQKQLSG